MAEALYARRLLATKNSRAGHVCRFAQLRRRRGAPRRAERPEIRTRVAVTPPIETALPPGIRRPFALGDQPTWLRRRIVSTVRARSRDRTLRLRKWPRFAPR